MTLRLTILLSLSLSLAVHGWQDSPAQWIKKTAIPLSTPEAGAGFADMQRLKALVGDARIVSLGEPTHGSREVFQLKHRMLEFLATEMGFTVFSIEASMPEAYKLNNYVQTGEGDPARLVRQLGFWTWDTEEVLAMVQWMREFNVRSKARLQFTGFDMQNPAMAIANVSAFVDANDPQYAGTLSAAKSKVAPTIPQTAYSPERWKAVVEHLHAQISTYRSQGIPVPAIEWALQNARIVLQGLPQTMVERPRDQSMADNVKWIADQNPGARMVLWAHNGHIAAAGFGEKTMGRYLRTMYGQQMLAMGILFGEGGFQAIAQTGRTLRTFRVPPAPQDTLDGAFVEAGLPLLALDLRNSPAWFGESRRSRFIGSIYPENEPFAFMAPIVARNLFDAVLFVRTTTPARPLPK